MVRELLSQNILRKIELENCPVFNIWGAGTTVEEKVLVEAVIEKVGQNTFSMHLLH